MGYLNPADLHYQEVTITNAQIKALRATPKTLVPAPGANRYLEFVSAIIELDAGTNVLTETVDNMAVKYTDGSGVAVSEAIECTGFIDQAADTVTRAIPVKDAIVAATGCVNKPLVLHNTGDGEFAGNAALDAILRVKTTYRVHRSGF